MPAPLQGREELQGSVAPWRIAPRLLCLRRYSGRYDKF